MNSIEPSCSASIFIWKPRCQKYHQKKNLSVEAKLNFRYETPQAEINLQLASSFCANEASKNGLMMLLAA